MLNRKNKWALYFSLFVLLSCNSSQKDQLNEINGSILKLKDELNKTQEISLKSTSPRYQIIQSSIAARGTYKVDTYEGKVYQLVVDANNNEQWQSLRRVSGSLSDTRVEGQRNYEMFLSTIAMRFTYLINLNTGSTWQLVEDPDDKEEYFTPIEN